MVFDLSGAHRIVVRYCFCDRRPPKRIQLLRSRWFPATIHRPSTAFTFDILDFFHKLQDQNKCNPYDFYHAILQRTDAAGLKPEIVRRFSSVVCACPHPIANLFLQYRYNEISLVLRLWTHLQRLKRGGAVHDSSIGGLTPEGRMAVACPACPQPGRNTKDFPESELYE